MYLIEHKIRNGEYEKLYTCETRAEAHEYLRIAGGGFPLPDNAGVYDLLKIVKSKHKTPYTELRDKETGDTYRLRKIQ